MTDFTRTCTPASPCSDDTCVSGAHAPRPRVVVDDTGYLELAKRLDALEELVAAHVARQTDVHGLTSGPVADRLTNHGALIGALDDNTGRLATRIDALEDRISLLQTLTDGLRTESEAEPEECSHCGHLPHIKTWCHQQIVGSNDPNVIGSRSCGCPPQADPPAPSDLDSADLKLPPTPEEWERSRAEVRYWRDKADVFQVNAEHNYSLWKGAEARVAALEKGCPGEVNHPEVNNCQMCGKWSEVDQTAGDYGGECPYCMWEETKEKIERLT